MATVDLTPSEMKDALQQAFQGNVHGCDGWVDFDLAVSDLLSDGYAIVRHLAGDAARTEEGG